MMFTPNLNPDIALGTKLVQPFCSINEDTGLALEFPRCAVECTTARLSDSCIQTCGPLLCCCASAGGSCIPCSETCPCPSCSDNAVGGNCPNGNENKFTVVSAAGNIDCCRRSPTMQPTLGPGETAQPTTAQPSDQPSEMPTSGATGAPTAEPSTAAPTAEPTAMPTDMPTTATPTATVAPSSSPSYAPTDTAYLYNPSAAPTPVSGAPSVTPAPTGTPAPTSVKAVNVFGYLMVTGLTLADCLSTKDVIAQGLATTMGVPASTITIGCQVAEKRRRLTVGEALVGFEVGPFGPDAPDEADAVVAAFVAAGPADITQDIVDAAAASSNPDAEVYAFGFSVDAYPDPEVVEAGTGLLWILL
mmetsp:Transcript_17959/g.56051  ORF Transcript_17959/g.56051 Transcript_17959/m.56051 type:complete len:360 (-) Transcript_17959:189-1268(-)